MYITYIYLYVCMCCMYLYIQYVCMYIYIYIGIYISVCRLIIIDRYIRMRESGCRPLVPAGLK